MPVGTWRSSNATRCPRSARATQRTPRSAPPRVASGTSGGSGDRRVVCYGVRLVCGGWFGMSVWFGVNRWVPVFGQLSTVWILVLYTKVLSSLETSALFDACFKGIHLTQSLSGSDVPLSPWPDLEVPTILWLPSVCDIEPKEFLGLLQDHRDQE